jgi:Flp pilus assembly pilin Flp
MIEYALLAALVALSGVASMPILSGRITASFTHVGTQLSSAM